MTTTKAKLKRIEKGEYEYRGRTIYRVDWHRDAYNPWRIAGGANAGFPTLAEARAYLDARAEAKAK